MAVDARLGASRRSLSAVIALNSAAPNEEVGPASLGFGDNEFVMPCLVAARGQPCAIVAFDRNLRTAERAAKIASAAPVESGDGPTGSEAA